jgi:hypothetical protein
MWNVSEQLASKESQNVVGLCTESHLVVDNMWSGQNCAPRASAILNGTPSKLIAVVVVEDACQSWEVAY